MEHELRCLGQVIAPCKIKYPQDLNGLNLRPFCRHTLLSKITADKTGSKISKVITLYCQNERGFRTKKLDLLRSVYYFLFIVFARWAGGNFFSEAGGYSVN